MTLPQKSIFSKIEQTFIEKYTAESAEVTEAMAVCGEKVIYTSRYYCGLYWITQTRWECNRNKT